MGKKVHPKAFRLNTVATWSSRWFADRRAYRQFLEQDVRMRKFVKSKFRDAGISEVEVERSTGNVTVTIYAARPGVIIGRGGQGAEQLKQELRKNFLGSSEQQKQNIQLNIIEVDRPALDAAVVLYQVVADIERRMPFRRVLRQALGRVERGGAQGVRIQVAGRLNGAEIARTESVKSGSVPLQTLRADISYASDFARTIYGSVGVKVWIYRGEVFEGRRSASAQRPTQTTPPSHRRGAARKQTAGRV
ncbi:MAG: 30S ribosomal protein S3 [Candidatus Uhrbacteria bacterium]